MKRKPSVPWLMPAIATASFAIFVLLAGIDQPRDWSLTAATFCFGISLAFSLTFAIGHTVHEIFEFEESYQENSLSKFLSLLVSFPTMVGSFLLTCHLSVEAGILFALVFALVALIALFRLGILKCECPLPRKPRAHRQIAAPTLLRAPISELSHHRNVV